MCSRHPLPKGRIGQTSAPSRRERLGQIEDLGEQAAGPLGIDGRDGCQPKLEAGSRQDASERVGPWLTAAALCALGLVVSVDVHWMKSTGAAVFGWSLLWSLPMLPYRVLGFGLSKHVAWDFGFALSLAIVALTVVAVGCLGRNATGRRWVGLLAAAFWTAWARPSLVMAPLVDSRR